MSTVKGNNIEEESSSSHPEYNLMNDMKHNAPISSNHDNIISIDDAIELLGYGPFQCRILWAAGLCFAADSMEVLLLSFLSVILQKEWDLSESQSSLITSSMFVGAFCGTLTLGMLGDLIGRRPVFTMTALIICIFGFLTAVCDTFMEVVLCRFAVGFGVGGLTVPFDTLAEFVPSSRRGTNLLVIEYFWTAGTLLVPVAAYVTLGDENAPNEWRWFVVLCAVPCLFSTVLGLLFVPESPRWLLSKNKPDEALEILREAATRNGKDHLVLFPTGITIIDEEEEGDSNCCDLLSSQWRRITLLLWVAWAGFAFLYYGTIIAVTLVFVEEDLGEQQQGFSFDYSAILTSASSELAGTTLVIVLIERIGRIPSQTLSFIGGGFSGLVLCLLATQEDAIRWQLIVSAFLARMFFMAASCTTWISTAEILTTEIRSTGHSAANAVARVSGAISPFVVSNTTPFAVIGATILGVSICTGACTWQLPETMGRVMGAKDLHHGDKNVGAGTE